MKLHIAPELDLPLESVTQPFAILAKRGAGKTYLASVMAEEMLKAGQHIIALDPTGAWNGLRSGFSIAIFGGDHGDLPLEEHAGEVIATAIVENHFSAVLDLSLFRKGQMVRFMVAFAETLYRLNREPIHLFVDEADAFAPQGRNMGGGEENRMLGAMDDLVRRGRKRGIGCTLITQRPAVLNKSVLTQCECLFTLRLTHPRDIDAVMEWVNVHAEPADAQDMLESLPSLGIGQAWFWSPGWLGLFKQIHVRQRETFDSGATPKPGQRLRRPKTFAELDVKSLGSQIAAAADQAKANDPRELRRRLAELEKQLADKPTPKDMVEVVKEVPVIRDGQLARLEKSIERADKAGTKLLDEAAKLRAAMGKVPTSSGAQYTLASILNHPNAIKTAAAVVAPKQAKPTAHLQLCREKLTGSAAAVLDAAASFPGGATRERIAVFSGRSIKSSTFQGAFSSTTGLVAMGLLRQVGDRYEPTPEGASIARPTAGTTLADWVSKLKNSEGRVLRAIADVYPQRVTRTQVSELTGQSEASSTFQTAFGALRALGLIEGQADFRAVDTLMEASQ